MLRKSHYLTLGVSRTETTEGIRHAFCDLIKRYHPDRLGSPGLRLFQDIVAAYRVLGDPERRRQYDAGLAHAQATATAWTPIVLDAESPPGSLVPEVQVPLRIDMRRASFEDAFARVAQYLRGDAAAPQERSEGLDVRMILPPEVALRGGVAFVNVPICAPCRLCGGTGQERLWACRLCDGEGINEEEETVSVRIPPQIGDGALFELPLPGMGVHNFYLRLQMRVGA